VYEGSSVKKLPLYKKELQKGDPLEGSFCVRGGKFPDTKRRFRIQTSPTLPWQGPPIKQTRSGTPSTEKVMGVSITRGRVQGTRGVLVTFSGQQPDGLEKAAHDGILRGKLSMAGRLPR